MYAEPLVSYQPGALPQTLRSRLAWGSLVKDAVQMMVR